LTLTGARVRDHGIVSTQDRRWSHEAVTPQFT
jgi:hypothetical protein